MIGYILLSCLHAPVHSFMTSLQKQLCSKRGPDTLVNQAEIISGPLHETTVIHQYDHEVQMVLLGLRTNPPPSRGRQGSKLFPRSQTGPDIEKASFLCVPLINPYPE
jgi:hypothetical protein